MSKPDENRDPKEPENTKSLGYWYSFEFDETTGETYTPKEESNGV